MKNNVLSDVFDKVQSEKRFVFYDDDNILAAMHRGNIRKIQQDSLLYTTHPRDAKFILLVLADGMGGLNSGEEASNYAIKMVYEWFINCDLKELSDKQALIKRVNEIDLLVRYNNPLSGTTLSIVIINSYNTFTFSIGDSRIYLLKDNEIAQITKDHTISWELYETGIIKKKDDIRYHKQNNLLTARIGWKTPLLKYDINNVDNNYDSLFLFSDGITDSISDEDLLKIILMSEREKTTKNIIDIALNISYYRDDFLSEDYYKKIYGGQDNLSIIMYNRKV